MDLPNRGNLLQVPSELETVDDEVDGSVRFRRYHLGRNGAVHGGAVAQRWDSVLGFAAFRLSRSFKQRTAYLHVNYRKIVPIDKELQVDARIDRSEGRKINVTGRLHDGDDLLCDAEALFVKLNPGQP
jgi:acyl-coenzyme A thioesterase PaaI-like protein